MKAKPIQALRVLAPGLMVLRFRLTPRALEGPQHQLLGNLTSFSIVLDGILPVQTFSGAIRPLGEGEGIFNPPGSTGLPRMDMLRGAVEALQVVFSPARMRDSPLIRPSLREPTYFKVRYPAAASKLASAFGGSNPMSTGDMEQSLIDWWGKEPFLFPFVASASAAGILNRQRALMEEIHRGDLVSLRIQELARSAGRDRFSFYRQFQKEWSFSPMEYLQFVRLSKAMELLTLDRTHSICLPAKAGFPDVSDFFKYFGRMVGISPQRFLIESGF